jgi:hypothetical protein
MRAALLTAEAREYVLYGIRVGGFGDEVQVLSNYISAVSSRVFLHYKILIAGILSTGTTAEFASAVLQQCFSSGARLANTGTTGRRWSFRLNEDNVQG